MERPAFPAMVSGSLLATPLAAEAQQPERTYRVAHLYAGPRSGNQAVLASFQQGMRELGYIGLPVMFTFREDVEAGGLVAYGANLASQYRQAATLVHKILRGARPSDLPVEQASKFEFVINLKTAKALGLTIPPSILARADQVIE